MLPRKDRLINQQNYALSFKLLHKADYWDPDKIESRERVDQWYFDEIPKADARLGMYNLFQCQMIPVLSTAKFGPNHHLWMQKFKNLFDPKGLSNPPAPFEFDELVEKADYLKGDWEEG